MRISRTRLTLKYLNHSQLLLPAGILAILGLMFAAMFVPSFIRDVRLAFEGKEIIATVTGKRIADADHASHVQASFVLAHGGRRRPARFLTYEFTVDGKQFFGTKHVSRTEWDRVVAGQQIEVVYLPSNPNVNRGDQPMWQNSTFLFFAVGILALTASFALILRAIADVGRRVSLVTDGLPALGIIERLDVDQKESDRSGRTCLKHLKYQFLTDSRGDQQLHDAQLTSNIPHLKRPIRIGDAILVLYREHDPTEHEIDWFDARPADLTHLLTTATQKATDN